MISECSVAVGAGTWPDWLAAVATSIALFVAAITYWRNRADRHVAQARRVYVTHTYEWHQKGDWADTGEGWAEQGALETFPDRSDEDRGYRLKMKAVHVRATVHNASDEIISNIEVTVSADNVERWPTAGDYVSRYVMAAIPPGGQRVVHFVVKDRWSTGFSVPGLDISVRLRFTDSAGAHWRRTDAQPVKELKQDNVGPPAFEGLITASSSYLGPLDDE